MANAKVIPDDRVQIEGEAVGEVASLRPGSVDQLTVSSDDIPAIVIRLVDEGEEPVPVGEVSMDGDLSGITVEYKDSNEPTAEWVPVNSDGSETPEVSCGLAPAGSGIWISIPICCRCLELTQKAHRP